MNLRSTLKVFSTTRRFLRTLERIAVASERQADLLQRLTDRVAPQPIAFHPEDLKTTGAAFSRDEEQARIQEYVERCEQDLKRQPTDEEIVRYLDGEEVRL
jgi:hypothetical protein